MLRIFWLLLIVSVMSGCASVASPEVAADPKASERMLLADRYQIQNACLDDLSSVGITCENAFPERDSASKVANRLPSFESRVWCVHRLLPVPTDRRSLPELALGANFCGRVLIDRRTDATGTEYYVARPVVMRSLGSSLVGKLEVTSGKDDIVWTALSKFIASAPLGSERAEEYMKVAQTRHAAAEAQAAYLRSDEYKRAQNNEAIKSCREKISYARGLIAEDDRVARISGYHNKRVREDAALMIVRCEDVLTQLGAKR